MNQPFKLQWIALAAMALTQSLAHAAGSSDLYQASASLGQITYRLVDLTPDDGQTPWIQINRGTGSGGQGGAFIPNGHETVGYYLGYGAPVAYTSGQFPNQPMSAQSADGMATAGASPEGLNVSIRASEDDWSRYSWNNYMANQSAAQAGDFAAYARRYDGADYVYDPVKNQITLKVLDQGATYDFTVSANTMVIAEASMGYRADIDHAAVAALGSGPRDLELNVSANSTLLLAWSHPLVNLNDSVWGDYYAAQDAFYAANPYSEGEAHQMHIDGSGQTLVNAALTNTTSTAQQGSVYMNLELYGAIFMPDVVGPIGGGGGVPSIPEPSTYLLMGLGLVGLAWARRRHQV